jgi:hypothetical protein
MYFDLKERKEALVRHNRYGDSERRMIAFEFGRLLSYTDEAINNMIMENGDLE